MRPDWHQTTLGSVCEKIGSGATPRGGGEVYVSEGISLIRSQNVHNFGFKRNGLAHISDAHARQLDGVTVKPHDVLLNITGDSVARTCQVIPEVLPARVNQHVAIIRPNDKCLIPRYLRYVLVQPSMQRHLLGLAASGATRNALTKQMIEDLNVILPPLPEQKAIAAVLSSLDDKIELLRKQSETLEKIAQTLFKEWFVEFNFPDKNGKPYKASGGKMVDSELGQIPEGWKVGTLVDEFEIIMGQSPPGSSYNLSHMGMKFFQGVTEYGFRFPGERLYTTKPKKIAQRFDVLLSVRAPVGQINVAPDRLCIGRGLSAIRSEFKSYCLYKVKSLGERIAKFDSEGTVFGAVTKDGLESLKVVIPDETLISNFEAGLSSIDARIFHNHKEITTLERTRDLLLPNLMSGGIRLKDFL